MSKATQRVVRPYGLWESPLSARSLASRMRLNDVQWALDVPNETDEESEDNDKAEDNGTALVWLEGRGKQSVLVVQQGAQAPRDLTGDLSVRAGLGYGGGEFHAAQGHVFFTASGRLYRQPLGSGSARPITPAFGAVASPVVSPDGRWLAYVHEYEWADGLALADSQGQQWPRKLDFSTDFVMQPAWHPFGTHIAYVTWNFPNMPWDGSELKLATLDLASGMPSLQSVEMLAGDAQTSVTQPEFSPDGRMLAYVSDAAGWWNLYVYDVASATHKQLTEGSADFGMPTWVQGIRTYGWTSDSRAIYTLRNDRGFFSLWRVDVASRRVERVGGLDDYTWLSQISVAPVGDKVAVIAGSPSIPDRVISFSPGSAPTIHKRSGAEALAPSQLSRPEAIEWAGHDGEDVHGLYYAPSSERFEGKGVPPLIVYVHGGPTSQARAVYSGNAQFFATRGFAVLEVNHRGSTGYGRAYWTKMNHLWGVYDVEDSASGAAALAARGLADPGKLVIMGGSAGGYTVLQSLVSKPGFYKAALCSYGISDQFAFVMDPEVKFEAQYSTMLLGPLPDAAETYRARSPIFHADRIVDPVLIFQGDEDKVVPKAQSEMIVAALRRRGVPHEYILFEGEGHGWRKPETIEAYYGHIMSFLKRYVLFA